MRDFLYAVKSMDIRIWIPVLMIIVPSLVRLLRKLPGMLRRVTPMPLVYYPEISIVVEVKDSAEELYPCLRSIANSTYPQDRIVVFLVDYRKRDDNFRILEHCQRAFPHMRIQMVNAAGSHRVALRSALRCSHGRYIFHLSAEAHLEPHALSVVVTAMEADPKLNCVTGTILTIPSRIVKMRAFPERLIANLEFLEHSQGFLGELTRIYETERAYGMTGDFCCVRKTAEPESLRFQKRVERGENVGGILRLYPKRKTKVEICRQAFCFVQPSSNLKEMYGRRFRFDRCYSLLHMLWFIALMSLMLTSRSLTASVWAAIGVYVLSVIKSFLCAGLASHRLRALPSIRRYYRRHLAGLTLLPAFRIGKLFVQFMGYMGRGIRED